MKNKLYPVFFFIPLILLNACGKDKDSDGGAPLNSTVEEQVSEGSYRAIVRPINNSLSGFIPTGGTEINITGDLVSIKTFLDDDARVPHMQSIHVSTRCPTLQDDSNQDGLIDIIEGQKITGSVLIPLDADLNSEDLGAGIYPAGKNYTYKESASLKSLEDDVKNRTNENLNLSGRVVMIHGTANETKLPDSVQSLEGMSKNASIPIACGILYRE